MSEKVITLPNRDEMLRRLIGVSDTMLQQERFYPLLLESAEGERSAQGVAAMLVLAIHDYVEDLPPIMARLMYPLAPKFVEALVDDQEVAEEAKSLLEEAFSVK